MSRRNGRKGKWLVTDDYTGFTRYSSEMQLDYWGNYAKKPIKRNLQEIASPLSDPEPVPFYRSPSYEVVSKSTALMTPEYVGLTTVETPSSFAGQVLGWEYGIGEMEIGSTFIVR